jgi:UDP-N-acetyl-D-mannosaminuronic acid transferase (WecB/TagA/CpsF family)
MLNADERARLRFAAARAKLVYPDAVGDLISRELISWEQFGYRIGGKQTIIELLEAVEKTYREFGTYGRAG